MLTLFVFRDDLHPVSPLYFLLLLLLLLLYSGLTTVLQTGNITYYPDACSTATASFSVLSQTIRTVQAILEKRDRTDLVALIRQLQGHEQTKLQLTAAHHLERIRQQSHDQSPAAAADPRVSKLLQEGVASLQQQIHVCSIENINEVLDELQCAMLEEE
jgi:hypothetical protein